MTFADLAKASNHTVDSWFAVHCSWVKFAGDTLTLEELISGSRVASELNIEHFQDARKHFLEDPTRLRQLLTNADARGSGGESWQTVMGSTLLHDESTAGNVLLRGWRKLCQSDPSTPWSFEMPLQRLWELCTPAAASTYAIRPLATKWRLYLH
jgi:hypothetical protein